MSEVEQHPVDQQQVDAQNQKPAVERKVLGNYSTYSKLSLVSALSLSQCLLFFC